MVLMNVVFHPPSRSDVERRRPDAEVHEDPEFLLQRILVPRMSVADSVRMPGAPGLALHLDRDLALVLGVAGKQVDSLHVAAECDGVPTAHVDLCCNEVLAGRADLPWMELHVQHLAWRTPQEPTNVRTLAVCDGYVGPGGRTSPYGVTYAFALARPTPPLAAVLRVKTG